APFFQPSPSIKNEDIQQSIVGMKGPHKAETVNKVSELSGTHKEGEISTETGATGGHSKLRPQASPFKENVPLRSS
ncbi:hypothetical protein AB205_0014760, partial [Aquarana catesbeiana]